MGEEIFMKSMWLVLTGVLALALGFTTSVQAQKVTVDEKLQDYKAADGVTGNLKTVGSDTMSNMMKLWGEGFRKYYPNVQIEIEDKGSATAPPALIAGTASFGPMSRPMKKTEINDFETKFGYKPTQLPTSIDSLGVYVHKDNPLKSLTMAQVDAIFSKFHKGGYEKDVKTWGELGLEGEWADKPISLYGRNAASGTNAFFKEHVLLNGDYKDGVKEQPGTSAVVQAVASDKFGIGYGGIGYVTADIRALDLAKNAKDKPVAANAVNTYKGEYPLSRFLYLYVNFKPNGELDPLRREFIKFVFSKQGQEVVLTDGYFPVKQVTAANTLKSVGLDK
jgi:phosphate transport system substrate-binding protein